MSDKTKWRVLYAATVAILLLWYFTFCGGSRITEEDLHNVAREAGDSAVTAFKSSKEMEEMLAKVVGDKLKDTISFYEGKLELATIIEIPGDTVFVRDTAHAEPEPEDPPEMASTWTLPTVDSLGVVVKSTLHFTPPIPRVVQINRDLHLSIQPDTLVVGLLRTEGGLNRIVALLESGRRLKVVDAAQLRRSRVTTLDRAWRVTKALSCIATGVQAGRVLSGANISGTYESIGTGTAAATCALGVKF